VHDGVPARHTPRPGDGPRGALRRVPRPRNACLRGGVSHWRARNPGTTGPPAPSEFKGHVVVVGSSAAGIAACESRASTPPVAPSRWSRRTPPRNTPARCWRTFFAGRIGRPAIYWPEADLQVRVLSAVGHALACQSLLLDDGTQLTSTASSWPRARAPPLFPFPAPTSPASTPCAISKTSTRSRSWPRPAAVRWCSAAQRRSPNLRSPTRPRGGGDRGCDFSLSALANGGCGSRPPRCRSVYSPRVDHSHRPRRRRDHRRRPRGRRAPG